MQQKRCSVIGCLRPYRASGYCRLHYDRWLRTGDPGGLARLKVRPYKPGTTCSVDSCNKPVKAFGWCNMHYWRWYRTGDVKADQGIRSGDLNPRWAGDKLSYRAIHHRLAKTPPSGPCAICGAQARNWAYDHADPDERTEIVAGRKLPYSINQLHYFPACVSCHRRFDNQHTRRKL
jgi:hypothetical protein